MAAAIHPARNPLNNIKTNNGTWHFCQAVKTVYVKKEITAAAIGNSCCLSEAVKTFKSHSTYRLLLFKPYGTISIAYRLKSGSGLLNIWHKSISLEE